MRAGWRGQNPEASWKSSLAKYGLGIADYVALLDSQGGVCAICGSPPQNNRLAVDHDHVTGDVRGLLCSPCNRHVGYFERFGPAIQGYLTNPPARDLT